MVVHLDFVKVNFQVVLKGKFYRIVGHCTTRTENHLGCISFSQYQAMDSFIG